jgi:hypothetical protein
MGGSHGCREVSHHKIKSSKCLQNVIKWLVQLRICLNILQDMHLFPDQILSQLPERTRDDTHYRPALTLGFHPSNAVRYWRGERNGQL